MLVCRYDSSLHQKRASERVFDGTMSRDLNCHIGSGLTPTAAAWNEPLLAEKIVMVGGEASAWAAQRQQQRHTYSREQVIGTDKHLQPEFPTDSFAHKSRVQTQLHRNWR